MQILQTKIFKTGESKHADAWVRDVLAGYADAHRAEGSASVEFSFSGLSFVTDGGDEYVGGYSWVSDDPDADILATVSHSLRG